MSQKSFDFIFIGAGAAGLQLLLTMLKDEDFREASYLILDSDKKELNDKTWCFWENAAGPYEDLIYKTWTKGEFITDNHHVSLDMAGYTYKMLRSIDFYNHAKEVIASHANVQWQNEKVIKATGKGVVNTEKGAYEGNIVFDSRVPAEFATDQKSTKLSQHFIGWVIQFEEDVFDPNSFVMMDYRDTKPGTTSFNYILPFDKQTALVEFTLFSAELLAEAEYEQYIKDYIKIHLKQDKYTILEKEHGVIPMSDFKFHQFHDGKMMKIGTAGGWVKPSSGYSFKISQKFIKQVIINLKTNKPPWQSVAKGKHRFYDAIFLQILAEQNEQGEQQFETMYTSLPGHLIFKFLDEQTTLGEDIRIMSKFTNPDFTKAFVQQLLKR